MLYVCIVYAHPFGHNEIKIKMQNARPIFAINYRVQKIKNLRGKKEALFGLTNTIAHLCRRLRADPFSPKLS